MDGVKQYILSVVCAGILCGIIQFPFLEKNNIATVIRLVSGLVLTVTVLSPLIKLDGVKLDSVWKGFCNDGQLAITDGESAAVTFVSDYIKNEVESYILNKARELGTEIRVGVSVDDGSPPVPCNVIIEGIATPYAKKQLTQYIADDLGISEENQIWIS